MASAKPPNDKFKPQGGEARLIKALREGKPCAFKYEGKDKESDKARTIRGDILGIILRSEKLPGRAKTIPLPRTVKITGAIITGALDMSDTNTGLVLQIKHSKFDAPLTFVRAKLAMLSFEKSETVGADLDFLKTTSHLWVDSLVNMGMFDFNSAKVGGQFSANEASLTNVGGIAINAQGAEIAGGVFLRRADIHGQAAFNSATIGGQFSANDANFTNDGGKAILAQGAEIAGHVFLRSATIKGEADLNGATIGGQFSAKGASFINPDGKALLFQGAAITDNLWLADMPHPPIGTVDLNNASIGSIVIDDHSFPIGRLILDGTRYSAIYKKGGHAHMKCEGWLVPTSIDVRKTRLTELRKELDRVQKDALGDREITDLPDAVQAQLSSLRKKTLSPHSDFTTPIGYWPAFNALAFALSKDGTTYLDAPSLQKKVRDILDKKISQQTATPRSPFAFRQFSKVLDANGHEREAREVRIQAARAYSARTTRDMKSPILKFSYRVWRQILRFTTGYGEKLQYAAFWLGGLFVTGSSLFGLFTPDMMPSKERFYLEDGTGEAYDVYKKTGVLPVEYPKFSPIIYSLDVMLPIVDIAQESHWRPKNKNSELLNPLTWNWPRLYNRFHLLMGWFLSTIGIAGLTGLLKDKREP